MIHDNKFDATGVVTDWLNGQGLSRLERASLLNAVNDGVKHNPKMKLLLAEIAQMAIEQRLDPVNGLALAFAYGQAIGVLLERYKSQKELV